VLLAVAWVGGCATVAPPAPPSAPSESSQRAWELRQAQLLPLNSWDLRGRVALRSAHDGGQASLHWVRAADQQVIDLRGPLGRGLVRLSQDAQGATLLDDNQRTYTAGNAEALLFETTGWHIPLDGLPYWVRGVPIPGAPLRLQLDDYGRLAVLWQSGWEVRFLAYTRVGVHDLPSRLTLLLAQGETEAAPSAHAEAGSYPVEARLVIEQWARLE
jgi:outer membrane lipoprotein LolB